MAQKYDTIGGGTQGAVSGGLSGAAALGSLGPWGIAAGALLGGIFGSKKTKVPRPPTYAEMLEGALSGQEKITPRTIQLERTYRPEYQNLNENTYMSQLFGDGNNLGYLDLMNRAREGSRAYENAATLDELNTVRNLSPIARDALMSQGQKELHGSLMSDAMTRLRAGTNLTEEDSYMAAQRARKAMAARGLGGRQGVAAEVLENNTLGIDRRDSAIKAAYDALRGETTFQNQANQAAQSGKDFMGNYGKLYTSSNLLGDAEGRIFNPQDSMNIQAMGGQYQHGMAMGRASLAGQQGLLNSLGAFGKFAAANPNMFGSTDSTPDIVGSAGGASFSDYNNNTFGSSVPNTFIQGGSNNSWSNPQGGFAPFNPYDYSYGGVSGGRG